MGKIENIKLLPNWKLYTLQEMIDNEIILSHLDGNHGELYPRKDEFVKSGVPYLSANCLIKGEINFLKSKYLTKKRADTFKKGVAKNNDVLFAHNATVGPVAILKTDFDFVILSTTLTYYRCNTDYLLPNYLRLFMISDYFKKQYTEVMKQATRNQVPITKQRTFYHLIPPLQEQKRIVSILDQTFIAIDKAKANAEQNLKNAKELFESFLQGVFESKGEDWEEKTLGDKDIVDIIDGDRGKNYPAKKDFLDNGYCLFMNTKNVRPNGFEFKTKMFITEKKDKSMGKGRLSRNDVIMTTRGTIGNLGIYDNDVSFKNIRINSGMLIFRPNLTRITPQYLFEVFRSGLFKKLIKKHVSGAAQPQLPIKTLVNFIIPIPKTIEEQKSIVQKINALSEQTKKLESIYQKKIENLEELKKSILQKAFKGELTQEEIAV